MFYYIIFPVVIALAAFADKSKRSVQKESSKNNSRFLRKSQHAFPWIAVALLLFIAATRTYEVGTDSFVYVYNFENGIAASNAPAFTLLNQIVRFFSEDYSAFFFATALLFLGICYYVVYKLSNSFALSTFVLTFGTFYVSTFNNTRQWIAAALLFLAIYFMIEKKPIKYLVAVAIASLFHSSALLFAPFYLLGNINVKPGKLLLATILIVPLAIVATAPLGLWIINHVPEFARYLSAEKYFLEKEDFAITDTLLMLFPLGLWAFCWTSGAPIKNSRKVNILVVASLVGFILAISTVNFFLASRLIQYFFLPQIILIPTLLHSLNDEKARNLAYVFTIIFYTTTFFMRITVVGLFEVDPYVSVFWS